MAIILGVALPFFAVLLCGTVASRQRLIDDAAVIGLNSFVFWFALPALLFHKVATTPFRRLTDWTLYVGYMGVPLLGAAYDEAAGLPAVLAVVLDIVVLQSLTILLLESGGARKGGLRSIGRSMARNPLIIAVFAGAAVAGLGLTLPTPVVGFLSLLGPAAAAGALFALGATLRPDALAADTGLVGATLAAKLLLLPAIAWLGFGLVPVPVDLQAPLLLTTALPTAASVFVIAQRYGVLERPVAAIVFASHLVGIVTLTVLLVLLGA